VRVAVRVRRWEAGGRRQEVGGWRRKEGGGVGSRR